MGRGWNPASQNTPSLSLHSSSSSPKTHSSSTTIAPIKIHTKTTILSFYTTQFRTPFLLQYGEYLCEKPVRLTRSSRFIYLDTKIWKTTIKTEPTTRSFQVSAILSFSLMAIERVNLCRKTEEAFVKPATGCDYQYALKINTLWSLLRSDSIK